MNEIPTEDLLQQLIRLRNTIVVVEEAHYGSQVLETTLVDQFVDVYETTVIAGEVFQNAVNMIIPKFKRQGIRNVLSPF